MDHNDLIKEQFHKQSATFGTMAGHYDALDFIVRLSQTTSKDNVLDVACGPGIVACAFAKTAHHVQGIDLVPAMIERAQDAQKAQGLNNMSWDIGAVNPLPYAPCAFSIVVSRFAFHHFLDPKAVLEEMARVAAWEGRVVLVDVFMNDKDQASAYDAMEKLRDPSHTHALLFEEINMMFEQAELTLIERQYYRLPVDVDELLKATLTPIKQAEAFKTIVQADVGVNKLGIEAKINDGKLCFSFPIMIVVAQKLPL